MIFRFFQCIFSVVFLFSCLNLFSAEGLIKISTEFPGGNVIVSENKPGYVEILPDLRGGNTWFYWHFESETVTPGTVEFVFPTAGSCLSAQGPAVSLDNGKTWAWIGRDNVNYRGSAPDNNPKYDSFRYEFRKQGERIRFAVGIPYLQSNLEAFLNANKANPNLEIKILTKTAGGRDVELLQIGKPAPAKKAMLITARHHACEAMASYVFEGFMQEALSDSPFGKEFREKYVLYCVPFVDKDGVQNGDQGKGRKPHDHNRDYGKNPSYPEIKAIQELAVKNHIEYALDFHCPALRGDIHEIFYFDGRRMPHLTANVQELVNWMSEERPPVLTGNEGIYLKDAKEAEPDDGLPFSIYFASKMNCIFAAALETPYAQSGTPLNAEIAREYGKSLLRAWVRSDFVPASSLEEKPPKAFSEFSEFKKSFTGSHDAIEKKALDVVSDKSLPGLERAEASIRLAGLYQRQKKYQDALQAYQSVINEPMASSAQKINATAQKLIILFDDPSTNPKDLDVEMEKFQNTPVSSAGQKYAVFGTAKTYYTNKKDYAKAIWYAELQLSNASRYEKGKTLNSIADIYDLSGNSEKAIDVRKQSADYLKTQLYPNVPVGIFGPMMANDLFEALNGIPGTPAEEKISAIQIALNHKVCPEWLKKQLTEELKKLENN